MNLENIRQDYLEDKKIYYLCLYQSLIETKDLCIWTDGDYINASDIDDYMERFMQGEETELLFETTIPEEIEEVKHILGKVNYLNRIDSLQQLVNNQKALVLKQ